MGGFVSQGFQLAQLVAGQQQTGKAAQAQAAQIAAQNQYLAQQQAVKEKQQRDLLQRQLASARARLSAGGMGVGSGSGQALLSGMVKDGESDIADSQALLQTRQANAGIGLSSGDGLLQGLNTVQKGWNILRGFGD